MLTVLSSGCGTFVERFPLDSHPKPPICYPATCFDGQLIAGPFIPDNYETSGFPKLAGCMLIGIVDLPISLAIDTVCIPYDIYVWEHPPIWVEEPTKK